MIARHTDKSDPATQEDLIRFPDSRKGRKRKYSKEILEKGYALAKESGNMKAAAELTGINYYVLRDWIRGQDRRKNPLEYAARRSARKTKHSTELLQHLLSRALLMSQGGKQGFYKACHLVCAGTDVKPMTLYHLKNSSRLPGV